MESKPDNSKTHPFFVKERINIGDAVRYVDKDNSEDIIAIVIAKIGKDYSFKCYGDNEIFYVGKEYLTKIG
jgi:hypothetical protein